MLARVCTHESTHRSRLNPAQVIRVEALCWITLSLGPVGQDNYRWNCSTGVSSPQWRRHFISSLKIQITECSSSRSTARWKWEHRLLKNSLTVSVLPFSFCTHHFCKGKCSGKMSLLINWSGVGEVLSLLRCPFNICLYLNSFYFHYLKKSTHRIDPQQIC